MESAGGKTVRNKEMQKGKEVHGRKEHRVWRSTLEAGPRAGMLKRILGGEMQDKSFGKCGGKGVRNKKIQEGKKVHGRKE